MKIKDITEKEFLSSSCFSTFYKVKIDNMYFVLKETYDPNYSLSNMIRSYENVLKLSDIDEIQKVYDFSLQDGKVQLLTEYLEGYENLIKVVVPSEEFKNNVFNKIINLFYKMWNRGFLNYDFTIINFLIKDENIKMIDLEFIVKENIEPFRLLWFFERIDIIKNWHGNSYDKIMKLKEEVLLKWKNF